jgi:protein-tyrosine-phosphatase
MPGNVAGALPKFAHEAQRPHLCTGNSSRSPMAEGILRAAVGDLIDVHSAGSKPAGYVHKKAIQVLK